MTASLEAKKPSEERGLCEQGSLALCPAHNARGRVFAYFFAVRQRSRRKKPNQSGNLRFPVGCPSLARREVRLSSRAARTHTRRGAGIVFSPAHRWDLLPSTRGNDAARCGAFASATGKEKSLLALAIYKGRRSVRLCASSSLSVSTHSSCHK